MKIFKTLLLFLFLTGWVNAQEYKHLYSLKQLTDSALMHYPLSGQKLIYDEQTGITQQNLESSFLPSVQLSGQATYQSDVTKLSIPIPGFSAPEMAQDWYKLNLDISQMIYDGGNLKNQRAVEEASYKTQINSVLQQEYHFRETIAKLYFRALLFEQSEKVLYSGAKALEASIREMQSALNEGTILQADVNALKAEYISVGQKITEIKSGRNATLRLLSTYTGIQLQAADSLIVPELKPEELSFLNLRPEFVQLGLQQEKLGKMQSLLSVKKRPIVSAFGQFGYGRPGLNMLDDDFSGYYTAGIRFSYKFWDWNITRRDKQILGLQQQILETEKANFELNLKANYAAQLEEISKLNELIKTDEEIIQLQETVVNAASKRMINGVITTAIYVQELEKLTKSQVNLQTNRIKLINANFDYMFLTGNFNSYE
ncbi:MAG: TolC family protein [Bacteroidales bacterium]